jgi:small subunit ribosomal protein S6
MRRYELMLLLRPDLEDDKLQSAVEKVTRAIVTAGGSLAKVSPWGKRRLAYEIKHHRDASYFLIHFDIEPAEIRPLERTLLISEEILRHLVTVIEERPADEAEAIKATPAAFAAEGEDGEDADDAPETPRTDALAAAATDDADEPSAARTEQPAAAEPVAGETASLDDAPDEVPAPDDERAPSEATA